MEVIFKDGQERSTPEWGPNQTANHSEVRPVGSSSVSASCNLWAPGTVTYPHHASASLSGAHSCDEG